MTELEIGTVEEINLERGEGTVRFFRGARCLFYARDGKEIIRQPSRLWFSKRCLNCLPKIGVQIICNRPGCGAVDQWTLLSLFEDWMLSEEAVSLQYGTPDGISSQDGFVEDVVLPRVRKKYPTKKFPHLIRRVDMENFSRVFNALLYRAWHDGESSTNQGRDEKLEQAAILCFENKPEGISRYSF